MTDETASMEITAKFSRPMSINLRARRIALAYAALGIAWILFSDMLVDGLFPERSASLAAQTVKGIFYVIVSTIFIYSVHRAFQTAEQDFLANQLERTKHLLDTVLSHLGEAVFVIDPQDGTIRRSNAAVTRIFGYQDSELAGQNMALLHPDAAAYDAFVDASKPILADHGILRRRLSMKRKDGQILETETTMISLNSDLGHHGGLVRIVRDITQRVRTEEALKASEERYRLLADNTMDVIWTMDSDAVFTFVNPAIEHMTGYTPEEFTGTTLGDHCSMKTCHPLQKAIEDRIAKGPPTSGFIIETEMLRKDGSPLPVEVHGKVLFDHEGRATGFQGTARDITERRAMEAQLRQSQKLEGIGTLASGVAHEINNPITVVSSYADLIAKGAVEADEIPKISSDIKQCAGRVTTIVRNLLGFARKEARHVLEPIQVGHIVDSMVSLVDAVMRHDRIELQIRIPDHLPPLLCNSQQMQQVVMNLLTNARDALNTGHFHQEGDKKIIVTARALETSGRRWVRTTVEDNGPGIPEGVRERMFDPFFTTKPADRGTGLGLWITYRIIKDHGGKIVVETEPGVSTRFHIDLPAAVR